MTSPRCLDFKASSHIVFLLQGILFCMARGQYKLEVPVKMSTFPNSCVVIPCTFNYLRTNSPKGNIIGKWHQVHMDNTDRVFLSSEGPNQRASFIGSLKEGNCSMLINAVQRDDAKRYIFRVEMAHFKYSYKEHTSLNVPDYPQHLLFDFPSQKLSENRTITVKCSTSYTCSFDAPKLVWSSHLGKVINAHTDEGKGMWKVESKQIIMTSRHHNGLSLTCQANYPSGATSPIMSGNLDITYSPEILQESLCRKNFSSVYCKCVAIANPPVDIHWNIHHLNITYKSNGFSFNSSTNGFGTVATLKGVMIPNTAIWCNASNKEGSVSYELPVYDKPEIFSDSHCQFSLNWIYCQCVVFARPPAVLHWGFGDPHINQTAHEFTIRSSMDSDRTVASLEGQVLFPQSIWCSATNDEGSVVYHLPLHVDWQTFILIGGGMLLFLTLSIIGVVVICRKYRSQKQEPLEKNSYIAMETMSKKESKGVKAVEVRGDGGKGSGVRNTKVTSPKKIQEDIYANMEPEEPDNIYQNE